MARWAMGRTDEPWEEDEDDAYWAHDGYEFEPEDEIPEEVEEAADQMDEAYTSATWKVEEDERLGFVT